MVDNVKYRFIQNVGDFFPSGYFGEDFIDRVQKVSGYTAEQITDVCSKYVQFRRKYDDYKNRIVTQVLRPKDSIRYTHEFHTQLLKLLGYADLGSPYSEHYILDEDHQELIPVRHVLRRNNNVQMLIMEMRPLIKVGDEEPAGLFEQQYDDESVPNKPSRFTAKHWSDVFTMPEGYRISPAVVNKAVSRIFLLPESRRPSYILMLAGNTVFLFDKEKWNRGSYLSFTLDDLFSQASIGAFRKYYALFHMLVSKETLSPDGESIMMDALVEDSYKNAYEVTKDLKEGVVNAVETLANEALWFWKHLDDDSDIYNPLKTIDYTDDTFETQVKDDCLTIVYRLLFLFYAESRTELEILPVGDEVYQRGYSLEMLRDLEQVRLISEESKRGYFIDISLKRLFHLLSHGHKEDQPKDKIDRSFRVRHIDSPMFDDRKLYHLGEVKFRNEKWQQIICALSLSKKKQGKGRGRISYANLGVNQLGSVYESLLAYRGFYAEEDYIEVHKADHPEDGTFLVPYSRLDDFKPAEVLHDETGDIKRLPRGTFVYRLNGRDRQKSASYYTPEVLTRSTVKYTLKAIIDEVREGKRRATELLDLKILEPAMGAAAFQNEVINQVAEAYLQYRQEEKRKEYMERASLTEDEVGDGSWRIAPDKYRDELQKVKAYIATHNVYGVDLNPTAIELGKLSLWLNVIHKDMETPFFANRLTVGNAVIGAWLKVYSRNDVIGKVKGKKMEPTAWWEKAPHKVKFFQNRVNRSVNDVYHFLLPDKGMLAALGIKDMKAAHPDEAKWMQAKMKDWTAPIREDDFRTLQRLSAKIDLLLHDAYDTQYKIERRTNNKKDIWPHEKQPESMFRQYEQAENYAEKERIFDTRYRHDNAYYKLKLVMDYWCALWFWEYDDADKLPTRREYWQEIEKLLDVSDVKLDANTKHAVRAARARTDEGPSIFDCMVCEDNPEYTTRRMTEEEAETVEKSKTEYLESTKAQATLFEPERFKIAKRLANRYHFFHPMLEFIEVFWLRDGFDIICGNPPWLKLQFDDKAVMSERFPEVVIHKVSAPDARRMQSEILSDPYMRAIYNAEQIEVQCSGAFMNAYANYPLLVGQQTNLYKCVLTNSFSLASESGYIGILTPESIYDDPNGQVLRKEIYHRLRYHFQYVNTLKLFSEILHWVVYGTQIFASRKESIDFLSISNLFHPNTIDGCMVHDGHGKCIGLKTQTGEWNTAPHKNRLIHYSSSQLMVLANAFENSEDYEVARLVKIHDVRIIDILRKISKFPTHVCDFEHNIQNGHHETGAVDEGIIIPSTKFPNVDIYEEIYKGPQLSIANALFKTPKSVCKSPSDYDTIDLESIDDYTTSRTNFIPKITLSEYKKLFKGFLIGQNEKGEDVYDDWLDYYKVTMRCMLSQPQERTLICAVLPRKTAHINAVVSTTFRRGDHCVDMAGLCASLPLDFYVKTIGIGQIAKVMLRSFPLGTPSIYKPALFARTLRLNCVTNRYADLWKEVWNPAYREEQWSISDMRLKPWNTLTEEWNHDTPLRNYFERRQALVEIDVIAAMALGLTLDELIMMYEIQFPVLQQNENDTWYDRNGRIVFTCSKGLVGVGVDRPVWNTIRDLQQGETYVHTIDPKKSELYGGQQVTYYAPFTKCDRIADYRRAWAHFDNIFNNKEK